MSKTFEKNRVGFFVIFTLFIAVLIAGYVLTARKNTSTSTQQPTQSAPPKIDQSLPGIAEVTKGLVKSPAGSDSDSHGCVPWKGFSWCESKKKCFNPKEESCEGTSSGKPVNSSP